MPSTVSVSSEDRFSKRFNRRFSLFLAPISRFPTPLPPAGLEKERVLFLRKELSPKEATGIGVLP